jgi:hypothetical protein
MKIKIEVEIDTENDLNTIEELIKELQNLVEYME